MPIRDGDLEEPSISIEGVPLSFGQAAALRVAVGAFLDKLEEPSFRKQLGQAGDVCWARLEEIVRLLHSKTDGRAPRANPT